MQTATTRVLVLFGAVPLYGQERANLRVFASVRELGIQAKFLINGEHGYMVVQPELDRLGFSYASAPFGPLVRDLLNPRNFWRIARGIVGTNWALWREIRRFRPTHIFTMNPLYVIYASPSIFLSRLPLVYRIGDDPPVSSRGYKVLWRLLTRRIDLLVANADYIARRCRDMGFPAQKMRRIYSSAPTAPRPKSGPVQIRVAHYEVPHRHEEVFLSREPGQFTAVFVGQLVPDKGFDLAVAAAERLIRSGRPVRLLVGGDYHYQRPGALAVKERIERSGLGKHVQFLGYVKNVPDLLSICDVHLCPSLWEEPLSNTVLEAKAAGIPSVVFRHGGLPETVRHGIDGWICDEETAEGLEKVLIYYMDHPAERLQQGAAARESAPADARFGWSRSANEWAAIFRESAGRRAAAPAER